MVTLAHRKNGYDLLFGSGLEIGALHEPAAIPDGATVQYFDVINEGQAAALFPEIPREKLVKIAFTGDLDKDGLDQFRDGSFDFIVMNHVLEHLANPVKAIREIFRISRKGGVAIIAIPDKGYTFDRGRELTAWPHLWSDYVNDVEENSDEHYENFLRSAGSHVFSERPENLKVHIQLARNRREHAHVWNSESFELFLRNCFRSLEIDVNLLYKSVASENLIEYFSAWQKR